MYRIKKYITINSANRYHNDKYNLDFINDKYQTEYTILP